MQMTSFKSTTPRGAPSTLAAATSQGPSPTSPNPSLKKAAARSLARELLALNGTYGCHTPWIITLNSPHLPKYVPPHSVVVEDKPCAIGTCPAAACNLDLTIEDVMSLDARSLIQGDSAGEVDKREHAQKDLVEKRKLAAESDNADA